MQILVPHEIMTPVNQRKKPLNDILRDINKRSKATIEMKAPQGANAVFEGTGPIDAVRVALQEVVSQLCTKQTIKVPIPVSVIGKVVGKGGATIQAIEKKTGARAKILNQEAAQNSEDDDDATVDVNIEGDPFAVRMAKQEIEKIVGEHTSSANARLKHIPAEYYPFLAGHQGLNALQNQRDLRLQIPHYRNWTNQAPPQAPSNRRPAAFTPQAGLPITIGGERQAVAEAKAEIDRLVQALQQELTLEHVPVERGRHQFLVGDKSSTSLDEFLQETGCSIILPPDHEDTENITIVGPPGRIDQATDKLMDLASSMFLASADVARVHANAPRGGQAHARDVSRYLQQRRAFEDLEKQYGASIVPDSTGAWQIFARDPKTAQRVRMDVVNLINGHPPTRFQPMNVDTFYHQHLREQAARQVRDQYGVRVVVPDEFDDSPVLLVFEERAPPSGYALPRGAPSPQDVQGFQTALQEAENHIQALMSGRQSIVSREVEAPIKFHDKIRKHVDRHHSTLEQGQIPVQMVYGGPRQAAQRRTAPTPNVSMRGPQDSVDALMQNLLAFIEQEQKDELERGFTLSFDFPAQYSSHLIGRKGENINRLREEFDVDIQVKDSTLR